MVGAAAAGLAAVFASLASFAAAFPAGATQTVKTSADAAVKAEYRILVIGFSPQENITITGDEPRCFF
jgi:hypothetical protein